MKAFKTFAEFNDDRKPADITPDWPQQVIDITEDEQKIYEEKGFTVLPDDQYEEYLSQRKNNLDTWEAAKPLPVPPQVTPRQMRQALILRNIPIDSIVAALDTLPEPQKSLAKVEWEYSLIFIRTNPLVNSIGAMLKYDSNQLDELWAFAGTL